jgi:hypothetical protein
VAQVDLETEWLRAQGCSGSAQRFPFVSFTPPKFNIYDFSLVSIFLLMLSLAFLNCLPFLIAMYLSLYFRFMEMPECGSNFHEVRYIDSRSWISLIPYYKKEQTASQSGFYTHMFMGIWKKIWFYRKLKLSRN